MTNRLVALRHARGMTQAELAEKAGVARSCVAYLEAGARTGQSRTHYRLAAALGVPLAVAFPASPAAQLEGIALTADRGDVATAA